MAATCTVDAELFDSLQDAIDFVAACGGGIVHTELAETLFAKGLQLPPAVELRPRRSPGGAIETSEQAA
jgi:hypothetical protein